MGDIRGVVLPSELQLSVDEDSVTKLPSADMLVNTDGISLPKLQLSFDDYDSPRPSQLLDIGTTPLIDDCTSSNSG